MLFGTPISWFFAEILSLILFFTCLIHATKQKDPALKLFEFFAFVMTAAIFENIGVYADVYNYNLHRIMLIGKVPLEILLIEAEILYAALVLVEYLNLPKWAQPFAVGLFASIQDMTIDPSAVFDLYLFDGKLSGQWNWTMLYDGGFFGIPFFNFSGWYTMTAYFTAFILMGRYFYQKKGSRIIGYAYPFISVLLSIILIVSPINRFLLSMYPFITDNTKIAEVIMLVINYSIPIMLLFLYRDRLTFIDLKKHKVIFLIPIILHGYDIIIGYGLKIKNAYVPAIVVSGVHILYLYFILRKSQKRIRSV